jgi:hypothetical protein
MSQEEYMRKIAVLLTIVSLILVACGSSDDSEDKPGLSSANTRQRATGEVLQYTSQPEDEPVSNSINLPDTLIYTTANGLFRWDFENGDSPEQIAADVDPSNISWAPDGSFFIYGEYQGNTLMGVRYEIDSNERTELIPIQETRFGGRPDSWSIWNWSPDSKWFMLQGDGFNRPSQLVRADGTRPAIEVEGEFFPQLLWTADDQAIVYSFAPPTSSVREPTDLNLLTLYDLETGESQDIIDDIDVEPINNTTNSEEQSLLLREALETAGFSLVEPAYYLGSVAPSEYTISYPEDYYSMGRYDTPTYCDDWSIIQNDPDSGDTTVIYEAPDANTLSGLVQLGDNSLIFLKFYYPDCEFGPPVAELLRLMPDGTIELISNELASAADSDEFRGFWSGTSRFRVSPDKSHVLWLALDEYGLERTLNVTDLENMTSRPLTVNGEPLVDVVSMFWVAV